MLVLMEQLAQQLCCVGHAFPTSSPGQEHNYMLLAALDINA